MDTSKLRFCGIGLLLMSVIPVTLGLQVSISQPIYEIARGDAVTITCNFQPKSAENRLIVISWTGDADGSFDDEGILFGTFYSNDNHVDINTMYEGKAQIESNVNERVSKLLLKHVTLRESRRIRCLVQIPGDTEGQISDTTSLEVLVAPSNPVCKIKGTAEYGQNISLTCVSEEGSPSPTYQWTSYDVKNNQRSLPLKATEKDGVLSLFNVSADTSGYYICTSTNKIRSAMCNLTLAVMPATMNIGATAGIIGGCVAGVAVLVLIIYCCCRDTKTEENPDDSPVIEYNDIPTQESEEGGPRDVRKTSIEGHIDQRERYEMKTQKDSDSNSNRRFDYDDHQGDAERYDDRRDIYHRGHDGDRREGHDDRKHYSDQRNQNDDRRSQYDDLTDQYDDRQNRYDGPRDRFSDQQDRYDDRRDRYDTRQDRFDDRRDHYNNRQEHYSNHHREHYGNPQERYDDGRGQYRQNRYDDDRNNFDDRRQDYGDRQGRYDNHRYRYGDRQDHYSDHRDRSERQDQYTDRHDH